MLTSEQTALVLSRLETGFRRNSSQLIAMEQEFQNRLPEIRRFGFQHSPRDSFLAEWNEAWADLGAVAVRLREVVARMDASIQGSTEHRLPGTLELWSRLQQENQQLEKALQTIRDLATALIAASPLPWSEMTRPVEVHLETLHACVQALRIKLELLRDPSGPEVQHWLETLFEQLGEESEDGVLPADEGGQKYREAVMAIGKEQHKVGGFTDTLKALLMWVETPGERIRKNLSLQLEGIQNSPDNS